MLPSSSNGNESGVIYKATGGFYYVHLDSGDDLECRARGIFRKEGRTPYVGDRVEVQRDEGGSGTVDQLLPRRNSLIRPPLANLDYMVVVLSVIDPAPNLVVVDKFLAVLEHKDIPPLIAITKSDLASPHELAQIYRAAGFPVFVVDCMSGEGTDAFARELVGKFSALSGNSGVGKSSLLNAIDPDLALEVGHTSKKLGRGRHTTRHVEVHALPGGGYVADTPGFTSLELTQMSDITARDLPHCFREFAQHSGCKFQDCTHTHERDCGVLDAVARGDIPPSRHQSYCQLRNEIKDIQDWQRK